MTTPQQREELRREHSKLEVFYEARVRRERCPRCLARAPCPVIRLLDELAAARAANSKLTQSLIGASKEIHQHLGGLASAREREKILNSSLAGAGQEANRLREQLADALNLASEVALGITHSPDCTPEQMCVRCERDRARERIAELDEKAAARLIQVTELGAKYALLREERDTLKQRLERMAQPSLDEEVDARYGFTLNKLEQRIEDLRQEFSEVHANTIRNFARERIGLRQRIQDLERDRKNYTDAMRVMSRTAISLGARVEELERVLRDCATALRLKEDDGLMDSVEVWTRMDLAATVAESLLSSPEPPDAEVKG